MQARSLPVKTIFWGTPEFALPSLEALMAHNYQLVGVISSPDERTGRKQILTPPPVKVVAERSGITILQPESLALIKQKLHELAPDIFIVAAYGKIIPKAILDIPKLGALNIHPSLLPRWRGPSPIQYTILNGDAETGVTIIKMDEKADHGPVIASSKFQVPSSKFTHQELHDRLAKLGAELLIDVLPKWLRGQITPIPQDESQTTYSKILTKDDGRIDWSKPAKEIERMVRAFNPWPGTWTMWGTKDRPLRLRIDESDIYPHTETLGVRVYEVKPRRMVESPGFVWKAGDGGVAVITGRGSLVVKKLTLEGKHTINADEFLRGHPDFIGATLT